MIATVHPFEQAGLGQAPFILMGFSEKVYQAAQGCPEQPAGTCDFCGTGIRYCCHIRSYDRKDFIVGCDCVRKVQRDDNRLVADMERAIANTERQKRAAKTAAKWQAKRAAQDAELQRQRDANGGLTDYEVRQITERNAERERAAAFRAKNAWLIAALDGMPGDFVASILGDLERREVATFSPRCLSILRGMYAKWATGGKRTGSKDYEAAAEEFDLKTGAQ